MTKKITFADLGLSESTLESINKKGFTEPTAIQTLTIPLFLQGTGDIIAQAQTGTGKTGAFGLPLIEMTNPHLKEVQALILAPTRELAVQVTDELNSLKGAKSLRILPIYGGKSIDRQIGDLKQGIQIVVGTPGRVMDHIRRKTLQLKKISCLVLDEADEMLNMGFIDAIEEIMTYTNPEKRTLLFSATMPQKIKYLAKKYLKEHEFISVKKDLTVPNLTKQTYFQLREGQKLDALCRIIDFEHTFYGVVFCRTKRDVDAVVNGLSDRGYNVEGIHGDISQPQRERTLNRFKSRKVDVMIASDVAARGIDINDLTHVINYALPQDTESYIHRIGRTGRAGKEGTALTFVTPTENKKFMLIQRASKSIISKGHIPEINDIIESKKKRILEDINKTAETGADEIYANWAKQLLENNQPTDVLAAILNYCFKKDLNPDSYRSFAKFTSPTDSAVDRKSRSEKKGHGSGEKGRLFVALGKKDKFTTGKLVKLITDRVSVSPSAIKNVQVMELFSFLTVPPGQAEKIIAAFKQKNKKPLIIHAKN